MSATQPGSIDPAVRSRNRSVQRFSREERRSIFRNMVMGELEAGFLRNSRRQALIQYAVTLGISEFDANLLIAEAQYHAAEIQPCGLHTPATLSALTQPDRLSIQLRLGFVLAAAICVDLLLIGWMFR